MKYNIVNFIALTILICRSESTAANSKNVLFVVVDDLRTALGCYGDPIMRTLNVDNLSRKSLLFEQAYVQVCPNADGTLGMNIVCPVEVDKMPEGTLPDIQMADFAVEFLQNMSKSKQPFFLGLGFHKPHIPLKYPKEYLKLYPLSEIGLAKYNTYPPRLPLVAWDPWTDLRERDDVQKLNVSFPFGPLPNDYQLLVRQSYYAATSYMDVQLGRVLSSLEENGLAENTIITFIGDHGWSLGEHQEWSKYSVFDVAARVPFLMYIPGVTFRKQEKKEKIFPFLDPLRDPPHSSIQKFSKGGQSNDEHLLLFKSEFELAKDTLESPQLGNNSFMYEAYRSSALVEMVDLFPTLADVAGLPALPLCPEYSSSVWLCTEGTSLLPLIKNITSSRVDTKLHKQSTSLNENHPSENNDELNSRHSSQEDMISLAEQCDPSLMLSISTPEWKKAVFSQYPRPSVMPREDSDSPHLKNIQIMGYSMWTPEFHYTEWVGFSPANYTANWEDVYGVELYIRSSDPYEINNMALFESCEALVKLLSKQLHQGWRAALPN